MRTLARFAGSLLLATLLLFGAAPAHAADAITQETPASIVVQVTGPGHPTSWDITARNTSAGTISPTLRFTEAQGPLFEGTHPAQISVTLDGAELYSGSASSLIHTDFPLGDIPQGAPMHVTATVLLPYAAGDEYRSADATVSWQFATLDASPPADSDWLAITGGSVLGVLIAGLAAVTMLLGMLLFFFARRRDSTAAES
ncbi:hypothetical protein ACWGOE_13550 [Leucobacter chromiiresistens]